MRRIRAGITALILTALVTSCGSGTSSGDDDQGSTSDPTAIKGDITYSMWDASALPGIKAQIADFNKTYPNVKVTPEVTPYDQYWTKLQTQGSSNTLPDVFWMNDLYIKLYASNGLLSPISDLVSSHRVDLANYPAALNQRFTVDGKVYAVMTQVGSNAVWYNKKLFDEAGLPHPKAGWTWSEFENDAKTVSDKLKSRGIYGVASDLGNQTTYYNTIYQNGGTVISPDGKKSGYGDPETIAGLQVWADLIANGSSPTVQQLSDTPGNKMFEAGKAAMHWDGSWTVKEVSESSVAHDVDVAPLPCGKRCGSIVAGLGNVISKNTRKMDASKAFVTYLDSKAAALIMAKQGSLIPSFNGSQATWAAAAPNYGLQVFVDAATKNPFLFPISKNTGAWENLESKILPDAFAGGTAMADAGRTLADQMNAALEHE
ncbi:ABC transporter substrate-binding protein [Kribbella sp. NPDC051586]|uniref:ABC transporter substrate-binding protein n=1 Tax=Kribbella sp. NPDC051586 TaxID=3364118 RepID=UPI0037BCD52B